MRIDLTSFDSLILGSSLFCYFATALAASKNTTHFKSSQK